ncbi:MAG: hydroxyacid dehydrogenase [Bacteroidales bacterium]|nr:hydroxyacid dehydrogenase [Bacteroidales bacterium]
MKITILEPIGITPDSLIKIKAGFESSGHEFITYNNRPDNDAEIIKRAQNSDVLILSNLPLSEDVINQCGSLKMISVAFAGVDHIPMDLCRKRTILVSNAAGYSNHAVAELVIGSAINLYRKINWCDSQTRKSATREGFLGSELYGKTFGIIGLGEIGTQVAHIANAFGCKVLAYSRTKKDIANVKLSDLKSVLKKSDIISIHVPLTNVTKHLIGEKELQSLKPTSILINTARGAIVDNVALSNILKNNMIAGAAIDVYEKEPPLEKDYTLFDAPNTILLPHIGYATKEAIELRGEIVIENIKSWIKGNPQNVMN